VVFFIGKNKFDNFNIRYTPSAMFEQFRFYLNIIR